MPLAQDGVPKGDLYTPQEQSYQGTWFHGIFYVSYFECDDFPKMRDRLLKREQGPHSVQDLQQSRARIFSRRSWHLPDGYTSLPSDSSSGALDYIRSPLLGAGTGALAVGAVVNCDAARPATVGSLATVRPRLQVLQTQLSAGPLKMYVFGEPFQDSSPVTQDGFKSQNGMHNVHMNQGDPPQSSDGHDHQADDGIWQDGATICESADGSLTAFCSKFVSQCLNTNDQGLPA